MFDYELFSAPFCRDVHPNANTDYCIMFRTSGQAREILALLSAHGVSTGPDDLISHRYNASPRITMYFVQMCQSLDTQITNFPFATRECVLCGTSGRRDIKRRIMTSRLLRHPEKPDICVARSQTSDRLPYSVHQQIAQDSRVTAYSPRNPPRAGKAHKQRSTSPLTP